MTTDTDVESNAEVAEYDREVQETATLMMEAWDRAKLRYFAYVVAPFWLAINGHTVAPVGMLFAISLLLPQIPQWSLARRFAFAGRRAWTLVAIGVVGASLGVSLNIIGGTGE